MHVDDFWSHFLSRNITLWCVFTLSVALMRDIATIGQPWMPNHSVNLPSKRSWSIVSKAADKSKSKKAVSSPRSWADKMSFWIYKRAVSVECPNLYADWISVEIPEFCMWDFNWLATIFSIYLETKLNPDTGLKLLILFRSSEGFFNSGVTWAILKASRNLLSANERFMIVVIDSVRISALSLTIWVEHGSRSHDFSPVAVQRT